jgi:hypothetical protein
MGAFIIIGHFPQSRCLPDEGDLKTYWVPGADIDNQSLHKWCKKYVAVLCLCKRGSGSVICI